MKTQFSLTIIVIIVGDHLAKRKAIEISVGNSRREQEKDTM